jgi:2-amino-4-hydroxy-6-hydroxymethyldihydropteridine diphosphokinase
VRAALALLGGRASPLIRSAPVGPSQRRYANAVTVIDSDETPDALLARLKRLERQLGRRRGRRWGARVIDLDIVLWSGGTWRSPSLLVPHAAFRERRFVLDPLVAVAPGWRDPVTGLTVRQLRTRLTLRRPTPRRAGMVRVRSSVGRASDF